MNSSQVQFIVPKRDFYFKEVIFNNLLIFKNFKAKKTNKEHENIFPLCKRGLRGIFENK
jgi:hypothetical protein